MQRKGLHVGKRKTPWRRDCIAWWRGRKCGVKGRRKRRPPSEKQKFTQRGIGVRSGIRDRGVRGPTRKAATRKRKPSESGWVVGGGLYPCSSTRAEERQQESKRGPSRKKLFSNRGEEEVGLVLSLGKVTHREKEGCVRRSSRLSLREGGNTCLTWVLFRRGKKVSRRSRGSTRLATQTS